MQFPKALLTYDGETFLNRLIRIFSEHCDQIVVITGAQTEEIRAGVTENPAVWVHNDGWKAGQLSSLQHGLEALGPGIKRCFWIPVDYPAVQSGTIAALLHAFEQSNWFTIPRYQGKHGHPVLANRMAVDALRHLQPPQTARDLIHGERARTRYVDVLDKGVLLDIDDPAAYAALSQVSS
jgi:molybdenum cofactor cytidylyltransferase